EAFIDGIETLRAKVAPGGVLSFAATLTAPAREEIAALVAEDGIGTDLILRSLPPLRTHTLRIGSAGHPAAEQRGLPRAQHRAPPAREASAGLGAEYGIGTDRILRSRPPRPIHKLRTASAGHSAAE